MELRELVAKAAKKCDPQSEYRLAQRLQIKQASISQWKSGRTRPDYEHTMELLKIAQGKRERRTAAVAAAILLALAGGLLHQPEANAGTGATSAGPFYTLYEVARRVFLRLATLRLFHLSSFRHNAVHV